MGYMDAFKALAPFEDTPSEFMPQDLKDRAVGAKRFLESSDRPGAFVQDWNKKPSIGYGQWNDNRAIDFLNRARTAHPDEARSILGEFDKMDNEWVLNNRSKVSEFMSTPGVERMQMQQMHTDMDMYLAAARKRGITGSGAGILAADLMHRHGMAGFDRIYRRGAESMSLSDLIKSVEDYENRQKAAHAENPTERTQQLVQNAALNKRRFGEYASRIGGTAGAILDLSELARYASRPSPGSTLPEDVKKAIDDTVRGGYASDASSSELTEAASPTDRFASTPFSEELSLQSDLFKQIIQDAFRQKKPQQRRDPIEVLIEAIFKQFLG